MRKFFLGLFLMIMLFLFVGMPAWGYDGLKFPDVVSTISLNSPFEQSTALAGTECLLVGQTHPESPMVAHCKKRHDVGKAGTYKTNGATVTNMTMRKLARDWILI